jgi:hypothetical protein
MSVLLTLPTELDKDETIPFDLVVIFRRVSPYHYTELASVPLGTATYSDSNGRIDDEYHVVFRDSMSGVESLPSSIYRALTPYLQRDEAGVVVVVLELDTVSTIPTVDFVAIYKRKFGEPNAVRIGLVPIGTALFSDPDGEPGDTYHSTFVDTTNSAESQPSDYVIANAGSGLVVISGRFEDLTGMSSETFSRNNRKTTRDIQIELHTRNDSVSRTPTARGQVLATNMAESHLNTDGRWSVVLIPNDIITPSMTYYVFQYRGNRFYKRIHSQYGPVQNFALLQDVDPNTEKERFRGRAF